MKKKIDKERPSQPEPGGRLSEAEALQSLEKVTRERVQGWGGRMS